MGVEEVRNAVEGLLTSNPHILQPEEKLELRQKPSGSYAAGATRSRNRGLCCHFAAHISSAQAFESRSLL